MTVATAPKQDNLQLSQVFSICTFHGKIFMLLEYEDGMVYHCGDNHMPGFDDFPNVCWRQEGKDNIFFTNYFLEGAILKADGIEELYPLRDALLLKKYTSETIESGVVFDDGSYVGIAYADSIISSETVKRLLEFNRKNGIVVDDFTCSLWDYTSNKMSNEQRNTLQLIGTYKGEQTSPYKQTFPNGNPAMDKLRLSTQEFIDSFIAERTIPRKKVIKLVTQ